MDKTGRPRWWLAGVVFCVKFTIEPYTKLTPLQPRSHACIQMTYATDADIKSTKQVGGLQARMSAWVRLRARSCGLDSDGRRGRITDWTPTEPPVDVGADFSTSITVGRNDLLFSPALPFSFYCSFSSPLILPFPFPLPLPPFLILPLLHLALCKSN